MGEISWGACPGEREERCEAPRAGAKRGQHRHVLLLDLPRARDRVSHVAVAWGHVCVSRPAAARVGRKTSSFAENKPPVTLESRPRPLPSARARMASHTARITTSSARPPPNARGLNAPPSAPACAGCRRVSNVRGVRSRRVFVLPAGTSTTLSKHCCSIHEVGLYQRRAAVKGDVAQCAQQLQQLLPLVLLRARR